MGHDKPLPQNDGVEQNEAAKAGADASTKLSVQAMSERRVGAPTDRVAVNDTVVSGDSGGGDRIVAKTPEEMGKQYGQALGNLPGSYQFAVLDSADFHVERANKAGNTQLAQAMQVHRDNLAQYVTTA